jgi:hypothetical protein
VGARLRLAYPCGSRQQLKEHLMTLTNRQSGTNVYEIADGVYRINTPVVIDGAGGFSFNQYLIVDDKPLLFNWSFRVLGGVTAGVGGILEGFA